MEIINLSTCPEHIPLLAQWFYDEWKYFSLEQEIRRLEECLATDTVPFTLVALECGKPIATVGIIMNDLEIRMDLSPWLASLYVLPSHRKKGIGTLLINEVIKKQEELKISPLYLFTTDQQSRYTKFDFQIKEELQYHNEPITVMERYINKT